MFEWITRANAWAVGDLRLLRELREVDPDSACIDALLSAPALQKGGLDDVASQTRPLRLHAILAQPPALTHSFVFTQPRPLPAGGISPMRLPARWC